MDNYYLPAVNKLENTLSVVILFLFSVSLLLVRVFLRGQVLELDESELVVWAQQLLPGYPSQPPLYNWLQFVFFQIVGVNLLSIALLKSLIWFGCIYYYHKICHLHISKPILVWCATLSWALIPAISFDLLKDNTHSVLVLLTTCITWYWFIAPSQLTQEVWYLRLGIIIGCGVLAKYNYLLFLSLFFITALSLPVYRPRLFNWRIIISILATILIVSPYAKWLINHANVGLNSVYKMQPIEKSHFNGIFQLMKACAFFVLPGSIIIYVFFRTKSFLPSSKENLFLYRYYLICFPFLLLIAVVLGFKDFETRWLIPILFSFPILLFSGYQRKGILIQAKKFIILCAVIQLFLILALIYRSYIGLNSHKGISFSAVKTVVQSQQQTIDYLVSDSNWLLGNLQLIAPLAKIIHLNYSTIPASSGSTSLIIWEGKNKPGWALERIKSANELNIIWIKNNTNLIVAGEIIQ